MGLFAALASRIGGALGHTARPQAPPPAADGSADDEHDGVNIAAGADKKPRKTRAVVEYVDVFSGTLDEVTREMNRRTRQAINLESLCVDQPRYSRRKTNDFCSPFRCRFYSPENGACPFRCRVIERADGTCVLQESTCGHNAHDTYTGVCLQPARGSTGSGPSGRAVNGSRLPDTSPRPRPAGKKILAPAIKAQIPLAAYEKKPDDLVHYARDHVDLPENVLGVLDTAEGARALKRARLHILGKENRAGSKGSAPPCTYKAIEQWCAASTYRVLSGKSDFKEHTAYVVDGWEVDSDTKYIAYVLTSEKLMKNLWHISQSGMPTILCIDTTHRLIAEGHSVFVCGVRDIAQKFHKVAYGVQVTDMNHAANVKMLRMVAQEYCRVKARRRWAA